MANLESFTTLSDHDLVATVHRLAGDERRATAALIASLAELDARRLYLGQGCSSMFTYCTQVLHLSEHAAYGRIEAARAARRFPIILERLAEGAITLTAVGLLTSHLTPDNHRELLDAARHRSKREIEHLVATLRPQPPVPSSVRKLRCPAQTLQAARVSPSCELTRPADLPAAANPASASARPSRPAVLSPLAPERYKVQFTADSGTFALLRRAQDLMRHRVPDGDVGAIVARALSLLVEHLEKTKSATGQRPRPFRGNAQGSRYIPAAVRREVWARDKGRCAFEGTQGRCTETGHLEFHHVRPFAAGGPPIAGNIQLRCRAHNLYESDEFFGPRRPPFVREVPPVLDWHG